MTEATSISLTHSHNGHTITVQPSDWTFHVSGPEFDEAAYKAVFSSFEAAKAEINRRLDEANRLRARNITLSATVINQLGERVSISRISRQTGDIIGLEKSRYCYPNVWWVIDALKELTRLRVEANTIEQRLKSVAIDRSRAYSRIDADRYGHYIDRLRTEIQEATKKAEAMATPIEAASITKESA